MGHFPQAQDAGRLVRFSTYSGQEDTVNVSIASSQRTVVAKNDKLYVFPLSVTILCLQAHSPSWSPRNIVCFDSRNNNKSKDNLGH